MFKKRNEENFLEIHVVSGDADSLDFKVYQTNPCSNGGRIAMDINKDLYIEGWVKKDGCMDFKIIDNGDAFHSCDYFGSFIEDLKWIENALLKYSTS